MDRPGQGGSWLPPQHTPWKDPTSTPLAQIHHGSHQRSASDLTEQGKVIIIYS